MQVPGGMAIICYPDKFTASSSVTSSVLGRFDKLVLKYSSDCWRKQLS